jgi:hypothetical protein
MEKVSDFFKEFKSRLSNPLFFSFIVAWLVINWRVPIGLLFYGFNDSKTYNPLAKDGYKSYIDLIHQLYSQWHFFWFPFWIAVGYTFVFPAVRNVIYAFNTWIRTWGDRWNLKISKEGQVPMMKFIKQKESYDKQTKALQDLFEKENLITDENNRLNTELITAGSRINDLNDKLNSWEQSNSVRVLDGDWKIESKDDPNVPMYYRFQNGLIRTSDQEHFSESNVCQIHWFFYNPHSQNICIAYSPNNETDRRFIQFLTASQATTKLEGVHIDVGTSREGKKYHYQSEIKYSRLSNT